MKKIAGWLIKRDFSVLDTFGLLCGYDLFRHFSSSGDLMGMAIGCLCLLLTTAIGVFLAHLLEKYSEK